MTILVSGLTLHNNKGGPALAMSLRDIVQKEFQNAKIVMSVPRTLYGLEEEEKWAKHYHIDRVFPSVGVKVLLSKILFNKKYRIQRGMFKKDLEGIDLIIDLNALSYMDLENLSFKQNMIRNLNIYTLRYFSNLWRIPMIRWTQSYGPFKYYITQQLVKHDLKNQGNIFVRGVNSYKNISKLCPDKKIYSFPDIAISLEQNSEYYQKNLLNKRYVSLSPSSVIYSMKKENYIHEFRKIIEHLLSKNIDIVLVPHNMMYKNANLYNCDLKVSEEIIKSIQSKQLHIVNEDLDVYTLKGIIANAHIHIGSRYHSIIASLSSAVPTIAFSWHEKYIDIMRMYEMHKYVHEKDDVIDDILEKIDTLLVTRHQTHLTLKSKQIDLLAEIEKNMKLCMENYNDLQSL